MRTLTFSIIFCSLLAVGAGKENVSPPRVDAVKEANSGSEEALKILNTRCSGCHQPDTLPGSNFMSAEKLSEKSTLDLLNTVIRKSKMPKPHRDFKSTKEGKKFLQWLDARLK